MRKTKPKYEAPTMELVLFEAADIVTASGFAGEEDTEGFLV